MTTPPPTLPELSETDATGAIAEIYADMRRLTGAPMVALIWRHLATRPGVLETVWEGIGPLYRAGEIQSTAWQCATEGILAPPADLGQGKLAAAGLDAAAQESFSRVLDAYNRVNPVNFIAVQLILRALSDRQPARELKPAVAMPAWSPPPPIRNIPAAMPIAAIEPRSRVLIDALSTDRNVDRSTVVPTLYRHFGSWPRLIPAIADALKPRFDNGEMAALVASLSNAMKARADALKTACGPIAGTASTQAVVPTLQRFSSLIPEMVVVGALLRRGADAP